MSENSKIEWCDHTFNPWEGCQKVGPGCDHCYAEVRNARFGGSTSVNWGPSAPRRRTSAANWRKPLQWNRDGTFYAVYGRRQRVFCASLADVFDNAAPAAWRHDLAALIDATPNLDWLLLTKRIGNAASMLSDMFPGAIPAHVWLGATVVNQAEADRDVPKLLATPAAVRFLSIEPMLGPIDLRQAHAAPVSLPRVDWVIAGGESAPHARPAHPDWFRSLRDQCAGADVPFLFKQWGEWAPGSGDFGAGRFVTTAIAHDGRTVPGGYTARDFPAGSTSADGWTMVHRAGKRDAGRLLDGVTHDEFPLIKTSAT